MTARIRIALVTTAVAAALAAGSGVANACINIHIAPSVGSARPGEPVGFSISGVLAGAQYTVSVDGHAVASGTSTGETISGSFAMPNLGTQSFATEITAMIVHADLEQSPWPTSAALQYEAPVAPPAHQTAPAPARTTAPVPTARAAVVRPHAAARPTTPVVASHATISTDTPAAVHVPAPVAHVSPKPQPPLVTPRTLAPRALDRPASIPQVDVVDLRAPAHTAWPLAALFLLLAALPPAAAYVWRRRRPQPRAPDEVEAELQEIIAEERARELERV